jgi:hypothetical protein
MNEDKSIIAYWQYHKTSTKHQRHGTPTEVNVFATKSALIITSQPVQTIINSICNAASGGSKWKHENVPYPYYSEEKEKSGSTIVSYKPDLQIVLTEDDLWKQVQTFNDLDADILLACLAQLLKGPRENDERTVWIFASLLLAYRGIIPVTKADPSSPSGRRSAGHRKEDLEMINRSMWRIQNLWITLEQTVVDQRKSKRSKTGPKYMEYTYDERILSVDGLWRQRELDELPKPGEPPAPPTSPPIGWKIRAGDWLQVFVDQRQVAYLSQSILNYDPYHEMWEKRLARYFFFHYRMNGNHGTLSRNIGTLLDTLSLPVDRRNPTQVTRKPFEKALNRLVKDGHLDSWEYAEEIEYPRSGWLDTWLSNGIKTTVNPPVKKVSEAVQKVITQ